MGSLGRSSCSALKNAKNLYKLGIKELLNGLMRKSLSLKRSCPILLASPVPLLIGRRSRILKTRLPVFGNKRKFFGANDLDLNGCSVEIKILNFFMQLLSSAGAVTAFNA